MSALRDVAHLRRALGAREPLVSRDSRLTWAAVALVLSDAGRGLEALFIRRAERPGDHWSGQMALPGGRRGPQDESLLATAIRETREEVGVDLGGVEVLGQLDDALPGTRVLPPVGVRPFVFHLPPPVPVRHSTEVAASVWIPLHVLAAPGSRREVEILVQGTPRRFPAYVVGPHIIWGLTERILTPFLAIAVSE